MTIFYTLIAYSLIIFYEGFPLFQKRQRKQLIIYFFLLSFSLVISILLALDVKILNLAVIINNIFAYLLKIITGSS